MRAAQGVIDAAYAEWQARLAVWMQAEQRVKALQVLAAVVRERRPLSELAHGIMTRVPQALLSFAVGRKAPLEQPLPGALLRQLQYPVQGEAVQLSTSSSSARDCASDAFSRIPCIRKPCIRG
jgi:hypothetical protein